MAVSPAMMWASNCPAVHSGGGGGLKRSVRATPRKLLYAARRPVVSMVVSVLSSGRRRFGRPRWIDVITASVGWSARSHDSVGHGVDLKASTQSTSDHRVVFSERVDVGIGAGFDDGQPPR